VPLVDGLNLTVDSFKREMVAETSRTDRPTETDQSEMPALVAGGRSL
jgi:hypothetical protein